MMAGADDDAVIALLQSPGHVVLLRFLTVEKTANWPA
jgi:hypothetical protein